MNLFSDETPGSVFSFFHATPKLDPQDYRERHFFLLRFTDTNLYYRQGSAGVHGPPSAAQCRARYA